jgi:hypothetical protein
MESEDTALADTLTWISEEDRNEVRLEISFIEEGLKQYFTVITLKHTGEFYLKSRGLGTYMRIDSPLFLRNRGIVSYGESNMAIVITPGEYG